MLGIAASSELPNREKAPFKTNGGDGRGQTNCESDHVDSPNAKYNKQTQTQQEVTRTQSYDV